LESRVHVPKKALAAEAVVAEASPFRPARIVIPERRRHRDTSRDVVLVVEVVIVVVVVVTIVTIVLIRLVDLCRRWMDPSIVIVITEHPTHACVIDAREETHAFVTDATPHCVFDGGGVDDARDESDE